MLKVKSILGKVYQSFFVKKSCPSIPFNLATNLLIYFFSTSVLRQKWTEPRVCLINRHNLRLNYLFKWTASVINFVSSMSRITSVLLAYLIDFCPSNISNIIIFGEWKLTFTDRLQWCFDLNFKQVESVNFWMKLVFF